MSNLSTYLFEDLAETYRLTLYIQSPTKLVLEQALKSWTYSFLAIWSILFAGIPLGVIGLFVFDCSKNGSCWDAQLWGLLLIMTPFIVTGALVAYVSLRRRTIILDRANNLYIRRVSTLLGDRTKIYPLSDVESVTIRKTRQRRERRVYCVYQLVITVRDRPPYLLPGMRNRRTVSHALVRMRSFL